MGIEHTCCVFGNRTINETEELGKRLYEIIENMIKNEQVDTFLFGSKSRFDDFCLDIITKIKEKYPHIKRIYVRAENISEIFCKAKREITCYRTLLNISRCSM